MNREKTIVRLTYLDHVEVTKDKYLKSVKPFKCTIYGEVLKEDDESVTVLSYNEEDSAELDKRAVNLDVYAVCIES